jgi:diphthamide synthase (EF-2-diphthine--ammonia ligase)
VTERAWLSWSSGKDSALALDVARADPGLAMVDRGIRATITCVDPRQLDPACAGRSFDRDLLADLPEQVDPCGENGEFHTFVHDGPGFATRSTYAWVRSSSVTGSSSPTSCPIPPPGIR